MAVARKRREEARKLLATDIDPGEHRKIMKTVSADRAANSFELVAHAEIFGGNGYMSQIDDSYEGKISRQDNKWRR